MGCVVDQSLHCSVLGHTCAHRVVEGSVAPKLEAVLKRRQLKIQFQERAFSPTWLFHPAVVIGVDAHIALLQPVRVLAAFQGLQLVVGLQVWPAPHSTVNHVRKPLSVRHLQTAIQTTRYRDTLCTRSGIRQRPLQLFQVPFLLLQLLHKRVYSLFRPLIIFITLFPCQKPFY